MGMKKWGEAEFEDEHLDLMRTKRGRDLLRRQLRAYHYNFKELLRRQLAGKVKTVQDSHAVMEAFVVSLIVNMINDYGTIIGNGKASGLTVIRELLKDIFNGVAEAQGVKVSDLEPEPDLKKDSFKSVSIHNKYLPEEAVKFIDETLARFITHNKEREEKAESFPIAAIEMLALSKSLAVSIICSAILALDMPKHEKKALGQYLAKRVAKLADVALDTDAGIARDYSIEVDNKTGKAEVLVKKLQGEA